VEELSHFLPQQAPLHTFVHHNTLHAFEHLHFEEAVLEASKLYSAEPYQQEAAFAQHSESGRILIADLEDVVDSDLSRQGRLEERIGDELRVSEYRVSRLRHLFEVPRGSALQWQLLEADILSSISTQVDAARRRWLMAWADRRCGDRPASERISAMLELLWHRIFDRAAMYTSSAERDVVRRRDQFVRAGCEDPDQRTTPLLIRLCAAYLDQGVSLWSMPSRELGFLRAVRRLYAQRVPSPEPWTRGLAEAFRIQEAENWSSERTIQNALGELGVPQARWREYLLATLLSLPGWAGMMRQFEVRPDRAPVEPRPARLIDFLAVQLTLDLFAARSALGQAFGPRGTWADLDAMRSRFQASAELELAFEAFMMAQIAAVNLEQFENDDFVISWMGAVSQFHSLERRRLLHLAFERRLRITVLDGIAAHTRLPATEPPPASLQVVFCIDDRECSTRRHLEESYPAVRTYGYAGFFGVAMAWQGLGEIRPRPLCPVNVTPRHYVTERALDPSEERAFLETRRRRGLRSHAVGRASRDLAAGGVVSALLGVFSVIPMMGHCLFPGIVDGAWSRVSRGMTREPETRLQFERTGEAMTPDGYFIGFNTQEMASIVEAALRTTMLSREFCELVVIIGHGSSSQNNPHGSAYDCGATGGGRGGPNARVFAAMANHAEVRRILASRGLPIPESTWFVGAYHNTCDDSMTFFDEDLMPDARMPALERAKRILENACSLDAHERCRRFESAPLTNDVIATLDHVRSRSVDLAQPRPECGHATNAYAIVGRRSRTRGLFLDRRAFLVSYDPTSDPEGVVLGNLLGAVVPVGAGINLEYYFSYVDPRKFGCGTKLPHNITGLFGVMDGHSSDLRTGLPWQMVEIHEPVRLLCVVEAEPRLLKKVAAANPALGQLIVNGWIQLAALSPDSDQIWEFIDNNFRPYQPESRVLPTVETSPDFYSGQMGSLGAARTSASAGARRLAQASGLRGR